MNNAVSEVTVNMIRSGVITTLAEAFPDMEVYGEEIKQGLEAPCFFVALLDFEQTRELNTRFMRYMPFDVHYFPKENSNADAHDMAEKLYSLFQFITINGVTYVVTNTKHEIVDEVMHFFFDINFRVKLSEADEVKMRTLKQEGALK